MKRDLSYFAVYKPFKMLSQFTPEGNKQTLADLYNFPKDVYPVGRLDYDSEGLLLLSNDKRVVNMLLNPRNRHCRSYYVQVEGDITGQALKQLRSGVEISLKKSNYKTLPAEVIKINEPPFIPPRNPPIRFRKEIPVSWIDITIREGKNRQIRKMTAKTGFPTLRLIRYKIENLMLPSFTPGAVWPIEPEMFWKLLNLKSNSLKVNDKSVPLLQSKKNYR